MLLKGFGVKQKLLEADVVGGAGDPGVDIVDDLADIGLDFGIDRVKGQGVFGAGDQNQLRTLGRFGLGGEEPADAGEVLDEGQARHAPDYAHLPDAADDEILAAVTDLNLGVEGGATEARRAVAVPADQRYAGNRKLQRGAFGSHHRVQIEFEAEAVLDLGDLFLAVFDLPFAAGTGYFFLILRNLVVHGVGRDGLRHIVVEQSGIDPERRGGAVFGQQYAMGDDLGLAAGGQKVEILGIPLRVEVEEIRPAGAGSIDAAGEGRSPVAAVTAAGGK